MPLPLVADSIDTIPEAARGAYVERDGKFHLDAPIEDTAGLKAKIAEKTAEAKRLGARAALIGDRTPEEIQADFELAAKAREDKAKADGQTDAWKTQVLAQHGKEIDKEKGLTAAEKARSDAAEARLHRLLVKDAASQEILNVGVEPEVLLPHVTAQLKVFDEDGEAVARVVDAKGNIRIGDAAGNPMTIAQLVETFRANPKFAGVFPASGAAGGGARNDGGSGGKGAAVTITAEEGKDVAKYRAAKAKAEKLGVPFIVQG